ncbi:hypothetical protein YQE_01685, partial [Dendroctonus ponderosae]
MKFVFKFKIIAVFIALFLCLVMLIYYLKLLENSNVDINSPLFKRTQIKSNKAIQTHFSPNITERIVHLDLKGAPPKLSYYSQLFPLLRKMGATGVLMGYEDMFPYSGTLENISSLNAYTLADVKEINNLAKQNRLKVVPFIPLLDNMDFLLKLEEFIDYREVQNFPSVICPSYNKALELLETIIDQVLDAHLESEIIHVGCNAVPHLGGEYTERSFDFAGRCDRCSNRIITQKLKKNQLFLGHIHVVTAMIKRKRPSIQVLVWDDFFRTADPNEIPADSVNASFQPVVWWYGKDVYDELGPSLWNLYSHIFPNLWLASAYKGAIGSYKYISDANHYIQNHKSWLSIMDEYHSKINFQGIILTGWQRYDHFAVLCELLPVGIPALAMRYQDSALGPPLEVAKMLQCEQPYGLMGTAFGSPKCKFPGGDILEYLNHFHQLDQEISELLEDPQVKGWLSDYNTASNFSNPTVVKVALISIDEIKAELEVVKEQISHSMLKIYYAHTVQEWLATYLEPVEKKVLHLWEAKHRILERTVWPRGPLIDAL